jgi:2-polyprenyl-6-methoxyphenol hydroxylase-like FAD-dependent oxidoreductase
MKKILHGKGENLEITFINQTTRKGKMTEEKNSVYQVLVIGGGPTGLMTAIQIKLRRPETSIMILNKHAAYQRHHTLQLSSESFDGIPGSNQNLLSQVAQESSTGTSKAVFNSMKYLSSMIHKHDQKYDDQDQDNKNPLQQVVARWNSASSIRTSTIESDLYQVAMNLNIRMERNVHVTDKNWNEIVNGRFRSVPLVIGADGAHSVVRKQIFHDEFQVQQEINYIIEVRYEVQGETRALNKFDETYKSLKLTDYLVLEQVGKYDATTKTTPITLHIVVSDEYVYQQMKGATYQTPYCIRLNQVIIPTTLMRTIQQWWRIREYVLGDRRTTSADEIITARVLTTYVSKHFVKSERNKTFALVGDGAMGLIFFRGLSVGFSCCTELSMCAVNFLDDYYASQTQPKPLAANILIGMFEIMKIPRQIFKSLLFGPLGFPKCFERYEEFAKVKGIFEIESAQIKNLLLESSFTSVRIARASPLEIIKWNDQVKLV